MTATASDKSVLVQDLRRRYGDMKITRDRISPQWQEIRDYVFPDRGFFSQLGEYRDDGVKRRRLLINSTPAQASRTLAAGLQGGLTSPSRPWFALGVADQSLREATGVRSWLQDVRDLMLRVFARSNFYETLHAAYEELGAYGTGGIIMEEDDQRVLRCRALTVGEYWCDTDANGVVDCLFVRTVFNVRQLVKKFGLDSLPVTIRGQAASKAWSVEYPVMHCILQREDADPKRRDASGMPWASFWMLEEGDEATAILRESGYRIKPFAITRWKVCGGDTWGKSPGMDALGDAQMLQKMERDKLEGLDKQVRPPMLAPTDMLQRGGVNITAGGVTFIDTSRQGGQAVGPAFQVQPKLADIAFEINRVEDRIRSAFYSNLFLSIIAEDKKMTAREVAERSQEKMMMLGPVIERFESELLDPIIDRAFDIINDRGLFPEAPQELVGQDVRPEYISLLAQAQKSSDVAALQDTIMFTANLAAIAGPAVADKLDGDQAVDEYSRLIGAPVRVIRSDDDVAEIRQQRAQEQAAMQAQAALSQAPQDAANLGKIKMDEDNALTRMVEEAF